MTLQEFINKNIKILNKVTSVPTVASNNGIYFVHGGESRGLYIVSEKYGKKSVHKLFDTVDYYTKTQVDETTKAIDKTTKAIDAKIDETAETINNKIDATKIDLDDKIEGYSSMSVRITYETYQEMMLDSEQPLDSETGQKLKYGQLVSVINDSDQLKNGIYRWVGGNWEKIAQIGDVTSKLDKGSFSGTASDLNAKTGEWASSDTGLIYPATRYHNKKLYRVRKGKTTTSQDIPTDESTVWENIDTIVNIQHITVNGEEVIPTENKTVNIETGIGNLKGVILNGKEQPVNDEEMVVMAIDIPSTDKSLDGISTNPISNSAVTTKFSEIESRTVAQMNAEISADETTVELQLLNASGQVFASTAFPAGGGGGGGDTDTTTKIVLVSSVDHPTIKEGEQAKLTYSYDHRYSTGDNKDQSTGQKASIEILIKFGATEVYSHTIPDVSSGTYEMDLTKYLQVGTTDVYVKAFVNKLDGSGTQTKQSYVSVKSYSLSLASSYSILNNIEGYASGDTVSIPFAITGVGDKEVIMYLDGVQFDTRLVSKSGTTNGTFSVSMAGLSSGRHTVQMVSSLTVGGIKIKSNSIYFDIFRSGDTVTRIATKQNFLDGRIFDSSKHLLPTLPTEQYGKFEFEFAVYDFNSTPVAMSVYQNGNLTQTVSVDRTVQTYTNRFPVQGNFSMKFKSGATEYPFVVSVNQSTVDITETKDGLVLKLDASGRSNSEANPAKWEYGNVSVLFDGFDFKSNGWTGTELKLTNGASISIPFKPFLNDASANGSTIEFEFTCSNIVDKDASIISCLFNNIGFKVTTQEAFLTSVAGSVVSTKFATDMAFKVAFVIQKKSGNRLLQIYVNGILCGCLQYAQTDSFIQTTPAGITVTSDNADILFKNIRIYSRALSDDEELSNYIVDREDSQEIVTLFNNNQVLDDAGAVSLDKLRTKGKSVMRIIGDIDLVNQTNNKSFEVPVTVYFYSAYGKAYDFVLTNGGLRIQGTSSTSYPRKNYRIYFDRKDKYGTTLVVGGVPQSVLKYSFKPGALPVSLFTIKADFAESSSTHNTGLAILLNKTWIACGLLTPPQRVDATVRTGIDGFPMDAFYDNNASNVNKYLGKYNFNNDKSGSAQIFGFQDVPGFNDAASLNGAENPCICLEFLNNSYPLGLFATANMAGFADALEFRYPEGMTWTSATAGKRNAIQRLWTWVKSCEGNPTKFKNEVSTYFDVDNLTAWYIATDYFMMCDQRVKNLMLATWDGLKWYFIPYDCDTVLGLRNDGKLVYDYTITEESRDESISSFCFAGHDSVLWNLVRAALTDKLQEVAQLIRSNMSKEEVLTMLNVTQMANWSERIYNKDGEYKYITPLLEGKGDWLSSLHGSRLAHRILTIISRFNLLDSRYLAGTYRADHIRMYFGHNFSADKKNILITASERYYFGYGYTSGAPKQSGVLAEGTGSVVSLTLETDLIVNDPQFIYGASKMKELDLRQVAPYILNDVDFSLCARLVKLDLTCLATQTTLTGLKVHACNALKELYITGLRGNIFTSIDLTGNTRLEVLQAGNTVLTGVEFATGAPVRLAVLPATLKTLKLRSLNKLSRANLTLEGKQNITSLWIEDCALLDWEQIFAEIPSVKNIRVNGINKIGGVEWLNTFYNKIGGISNDGSLISTCTLIGTYQLTTYLNDSDYANYRAYFPELDIKQPEYSRYTMYLNVSDPSCLHNDDNGTGYDPDLVIQTNKYVPSGHVKNILGKIHRYLSKISGQGIASVIQLDDANSTKFLDGSTAPVDGTNGDVMVKFPHYWYKGVNDPLTNKVYICMSSNEQKPSSSTEIKILSQSDSLEGAGGFYLDVSKPNVSGAKTSNSIFAIAKVKIEGFDRVRVAIPPYAPALPNVGALFLDASNNIIGIAKVSNELITEGMYSIHKIPAGTVYLYFTYSVTFGFPKIVLGTIKALPEDFEPEWVESTEYLTGAFIPSIDASGKIRSKADLTGSTSGTAKFSTEQSVYDSLAQRAMSILSYERRKNISWLYFLKYGNTRMHTVIGDGSNYNRFLGSRFQYGLSAIKGITDTVSNGYYVKDQFGSTTLVPNADSHSNLFGLENLLSVINYGNAVVKSRISALHPLYLRLKNMPQNSFEDRKIPVQAIDGNYYAAGTANTTYFRRMVFEKFLDLFPSGVINDGSNSLYLASYSSIAYCDQGLMNVNLGLISSIISEKFGAFTSSNDYNPSQPGTISVRMTWDRKITEVTDKNVFNNIIEIA